MALLTGFQDGSPGTFIAFVDSIQAEPTVRLSLNDNQPFLTTDADWSPPQMRRARATSMIVDGDLITAGRHGNRIITLTVRCVTSSSDVTSAALSLLSYELERDNNILMVQDGAHPTFFRTWRSPDFKLASINHGLNAVTQTITLEAEPYALGLPVVVAELAEIDPDPANGGEYLDVNGVIGDVETPLHIIVGLPPTAANNGVAGGTSIFSVRRGGNPSAVSHWLQAEICSPGFDTAPSTFYNTVDESGTVNPYMRCDFSTQPGMGNRFGWLFPNAPSVDARGSYRLIVRARVAQGSGTTTVHMQAMYNGMPLLTRPQGVPRLVPDTADGHNYLIDLGEFHAPTGPDAVTFGYSNEPMPIDSGGSIAIWVQAERVSGTGTLDMDYAYLIPCDDQFAAVTWGGAVAYSWGVLDGPADAVYQIVAPTTPPAIPIETPSAHTLRGALPYVSPGNNRLYFIANTDWTYAPDVIPGYATSLTVMYWPRYLALATA